MEKILKKIVATFNLKILSIMACFALSITTLASNQCCWFVMYDEELPSGTEKLRRF